MTSEADRKLVADEVARCRTMAVKESRAAAYWTGRANIFEDAPTGPAAEMLRELSLLALSDERDPEVWLKWLELNFLAQAARRRAGLPPRRDDTMSRMLGV